MMIGLQPTTADQDHTAVLPKTIASGVRNITFECPGNISHMEYADISHRCIIMLSNMVQLSRESGRHYTSSSFAPAPQNERTSERVKRLKNSIRIA